MGKYTSSNTVKLKDYFKDYVFYNKSGTEYKWSDKDKVDKIKNFANTYGLIESHKGKDIVCFVGDESVMYFWLVFQSKKYPNLVPKQLELDMVKKAIIAPYCYSEADDMVFWK